MEALAAFGVNWKLLLIQGVNFIVLLGLLYRFLYRPLFAILDKRQQEIAKGLQDAKDAAQEKVKIAEEKDVIITQAREEGGHIVDELRKQAVLQEREILRSAQEKSSALIAEARVKAQDEHEHIVRESEKEVARLAVLAAEKILRAHPHNP